MNERGQTTVLVLGMALLAFALSGVAVDGTRAWLYRRTLQNAADGAALAGAAELDRSAYYASGGESVVLDADARARGDELVVGASAGRAGVGPVD